ncbi:MAG: 2-oxoacid:ferredoxin oxidoreductase subunit beta [Firmicutes bacterium]|jgi:2-oxoglutarate ferredoxin oxidoreductase subunit beta|nr:2-oxoacid:ferredoxin oxidoreductase subunit beta [Bacillota bacterium]
MSNGRELLRLNKMPHIWCPGCGNGIITSQVLRAIQELEWDQDKTVIVSGIGCSSRAPGYLDFSTLHTTHGRALAFATGLKYANPELKVIVLTGDGDSAAIGGNHLIHACRRNIDITTIVFNNSIYGMTSGQYSPLTPTGSLATTAPYGNIDRTFDLSQLAVAAGATYVARTTTYHTNQLRDFIKKGMQNKGFSVIEAVTHCPTYFGRRNRMGGAVEMLNWQKDHAVPIRAAERLSEEELADKFIIGEFHNKPEPEYCERYAQLIANTKGQE